MMKLLDGLNWAGLDIDYLLTQSYKDFHAKGLDYVCLHRTPSLTLKAYFFADGMESQRVGEVINPHDHRYDFDTQTYSGVIENRTYRVPPCWDGESIESECGTLYNAFTYMTPLNGGNGFEEAGTIPLQMKSRIQYPAGQHYAMAYDEFHTIRVVEPETVIVLAQYYDVVPVDVPTFTFTTADEPPTLAGLYTEFKADELISRINLLQELEGKL